MIEGLSSQSDVVDTAPSTVDRLILDLIEWVSARDRTYAEVLEAWRTSCPRLPVWEEATERGLVEAEPGPGVCLIRVTPRGQALLRDRRPGRR